MPRIRVPLAFGHAEFEAFGQFRRVGGRLVPRRVDVFFESVDDQPALEMQLVVIRGQPQCRELTIRSAPKGSAITAGALRPIRIAAWEEEIYAEVAAHIHERDGGYGFGLPSNPIIDGPRRFDGAPALGVPDKRVRDEATEAIRDGIRRRKLSRDFLEEVRDVYQANPKRPTAAVAEHFTAAMHRKVSHRTAGYWVKACESAGLLPATVPGRKRR